MRSAIFYCAAALATCAFASPIGKRDDDVLSFQNVSPYLPDGFPNPSPSQIQQIQERAHGTIPNIPLPSNLSPEGITNFKLIALNEIFEVAFFFELVQNITNNVQGYQLGEGRDKILEELNVILAVEELHALAANAILQANGVDPIQPCKYNFPVSDYQSAIALASTFTDVVLGTLQEVNAIFSQNGDHGLVQLISSVIVNEGEQEGLFRIIEKKTTPAQPFLTSSARDFAFTIIQSFIVAGSCPNIAEIPLKTYQPLNILTQDIQKETQELEFTFSVNDVDVDVNSLFLVLINAQNAPIVITLENIQVDQDSGIVSFTVEFPFDEFLLYGLTIAAVTKGEGPYADADAVAKETLFGPGLIQVN